MLNNFKNVLQVLDYFKDEAVCKNFLAVKRWGETPCCHHCGNAGAYVTKRGYTCKAKQCGKKFTVTTGTVFENTKISLRLWFATIYLVSAHKKGISSLQLSRDLGITQKTAWFLLHRVREMLTYHANAPLTGVVEVDETFVGGKNKNRHEKKKIDGAGGRSTADKTAVVGLLQRNGKVQTHVVADTEKDTLQHIIYSNVHQDARVITDTYSSYKGLGEVYDHESVKHTEGNYITEGDKHTNNIEGFWSLLKRGIIGIYHYVSPKHLQRYCHEFGYRYNTRKVSDILRFDDLLQLADGKRLTYKMLIA